jgi:hypothetical protein
MRSSTAVQRCCAESPLSEEEHRRAFPQVKDGVVGLAGLEPAASSLSGISAGCVQAARASEGQLMRVVELTVVVRSVP